MKASCKSIDVFEFREEDELTEMTARSFASKFRRSHAPDHEYFFLDSVNWGAEIHTKEMCEIVDAADVDQNCAAAGSFSPLEIENLDEEKMSGSSNDLHNNFETHEKASEINSNILEPESVCPVVESALIPEATACSKDQSKFPFSESSFDVLFISITFKLFPCKTVTLQLWEVQVSREKQKMGKKITHCKLWYLNNFMILRVIDQSSNFWCFMDSRNHQPRSLVVVHVFPVEK